MAIFLIKWSYFLEYLVSVSTMTTSLAARYFERNATTQKCRFSHVLSSIILQHCLCSFTLSRPKPLLPWITPWLPQASEAKFGKLGGNAILREKMYRYILQKLKRHSHGNFTTFKSLTRYKISPLRVYVKNIKKWHLSVFFMNMHEICWSRIKMLSDSIISRYGEHHNTYFLFNDRHLNFSYILHP